MTSTTKVFPPLVNGISALIIFCLHTAWNCWTFLDVSADVDATMDLLGVDESKVGMLDTIALLGILCFMPLATVCRYPRAFLWAGAFLNLASPVLRFFGAQVGNYELIAISFAGSGAAFGVLGLWPTILAATFFHEPRRALVTGIAVMSNWLAGALASVLKPARTRGSGDKLVALLRTQVFISVALAVLTAFWVVIPNIRDRASLALKKECQACSKITVAARISLFGIVMGLAVAMQNANTILFHKMGFSDATAGVANCVFQVVGSVTGVTVGAFVINRHQLRKALWSLISLAFFSCLGMFVFCLVIKHCFREKDSGLIILIIFYVLVSLEGASLVGCLPLALQQAVNVAHPASENFVSGLVTIIAMVSASALNQFVATYSDQHATLLICASMSTSAMIFVWLEHRHCMESREESFLVTNDCES